MKEFVMIFRNEATPEARFNPDEMQNMMKAWQNWMGGMAEQGKLVSSGNRLGTDGKAVRPGNVVTNGPYAEVKEIIGGYIIVRADSIDGAVEMAKDCPMIIGGEGVVEIRDVVPISA